VNYSNDKVGNLLTAAATAVGVTRTYDARNLLFTVSRLDGVSSQYAYDALGRLVALTHAAGTGILNAQTYGYDAVGYRNAATNTIAQPLVTQAVTLQPTTPIMNKRSLGRQRTPSMPTGIWFPQPH
jgi:YD repeat-containing protein